MCKSIFFSTILLNPPVINAKLVGKVFELQKWETYNELQPVYFNANLI